MAHCRQTLSFIAPGSRMSRMSRIATQLSLTLNIVNFYEELLHAECKKNANILTVAVSLVSVCVVCSLIVWRFDFVWFLSPVVFAPFERRSPCVMINCLCLIK